MISLTRPLNLTCDLSFRLSLMQELHQRSRRLLVEIETVILYRPPTRPLSWTHIVSGSYHVSCTFSSHTVTRLRLQGDTVLPRKDFAAVIWKRKMFVDFAVNRGSRPLKDSPESWSNGRDEPTYFPRERPRHLKITARNIGRGLGGLII